MLNRHTRLNGWKIAPFIFFSIIFTTSLNAAETDRPNIIIMMSDDMGFSDIGCYGSEINTPTLDNLAANGLRFTQFYNTGRCCPTRASLLTGLYQHQTGIGHMTNNRGLKGYTGDLNNECVTIAEVLKPAGYRTYMSGKWHVCNNRQQDGPKHRWPLQRGFDKFYGIIAGAANFFDPATLCRQNDLISPLRDPEYQPETYYFTDAISDNAVSYIQQHQKETPGKPFFLYVAYTAAHWPMQALPKDIAKYEGKYDQGYKAIRQARFKKLKELGLIDPKWDLTPRAGDWSDNEKFNAWDARNMEVYAAMVDNMDQGISRIVKTLKKLNQFDNTLIFFLQDNGGCAEGFGRTNNIRWELEGVKPMDPEAIQMNLWPPMRTRDGRAVLGGPDVMAGPADTYIAYGQNWANVSNTPFREYKHWVHEGGIATPLIAHWPNGLKRRGELEHQPGHLIDLMATCVEVAEAQYPKEKDDVKIQTMEGVSLVPTFSNKKLERDTIYWEHEGNRAIREGKWKLVAKSPRGDWELYDMEKDRTEMHDLTDKYPEKVKELAEKWETWAKRARVLPWPYRGKYDHLFKKKHTFDKDTMKKTLLREAAPAVEGRAFTITGKFIYSGTNGVIVAQGGNSLGYAVYVMENRLHFGLRRLGVFTRVSSLKPLKNGVVSFEASLDEDGKLTLDVHGLDKNIAETEGALPDRPGEAFHIGIDLDTLVGDYSGNNRYPEEIEKITIELFD